MEPPRGSSRSSLVACHLPGWTPPRVPQRVAQRMVQPMPEEAKRLDSLRGAVIRKFMVDTSGRGGWFTGRVLDVDLDCCTGEAAYHVRYDEDGDEEHLTAAEVLEWQLPQLGPRPSSLPPMEDTSLARAPPWKPACLCLALAALAWGLFATSPEDSAAAKPASAKPMPASWMVQEQDLRTQPPMDVQWLVDRQPQPQAVAPDDRSHTPQMRIPVREAQWQNHGDPIQDARRAQQPIDLQLHIAPQARADAGGRVGLELPQCRGSCQAGALTALLAAATAAATFGLAARARKHDAASDAGDGASDGGEPVLVPESPEPPEASRPTMEQPHVPQQASRPGVGQPQRPQRAPQQAQQQAPQQAPQQAESRVLQPLQENPGSTKRQRSTPGAPRKRRRTMAEDQPPNVGQVRFKYTDSLKRAVAMGYPDTPDLRETITYANGRLEDAINNMLDCE